MMLSTNSFISILNLQKVYAIGKKDKTQQGDY